VPEVSSKSIRAALRDSWQRQWPAGIVLVLAAPWLLFPTLAPGVTALMLLLLLASWWTSGRFPWPVSLFNPILLLWSVTLLVGVVVSRDPDLTLPKVLGLLFGLAIWRQLAMTIGNGVQLRRATTLFILLGSAMVLVGALSTDWKLEIPLFQRWRPSLPPRLFLLTTGDGVHMNQLAGILAFFLPFLLPLWGGWQPQRRRWLFVVGGGLLIGALGWLLLLSQSRSAWLGVLGGSGLGLILWTATTPKMSKWWWVAASILVIGVLASAAAVWWIGPDNVARVWRELPPETAVGSFSTFAFRRELWHWAVTAIADSPVTGVGLGAFRRVIFRRYTTPLDSTFDVSHAHNIFLQVGLDVGLPGLIAYVALLGLAFYIGWRVIRETPSLRPLALGLLSGITALHVYGLLDALAPGSKPGWILWYGFGLLAAMAAMLEDVGKGFLTLHKPDVTSQADERR
jgi:putative inorganic carbon (HCO3(-)) transporter